MSAQSTCDHIGAIATVKHPQHHVCEECVKIKAQWVHLRICQNCGATLCCDSSPNRHASAHARASGHPGELSSLQTGHALSGSLSGLHELTMMRRERGSGDSEITW